MTQADPAPPKPRVAFAVLAALLPIPAVVLTLAVLGVAVRGQLVRALQEGGPAAYGVLALTLLGAVGSSVLLFFKARGAAAPAVLAALLAVASWLAGLAGMQWGLKQVAAVLGAVNPADAATIFLAGAAEANAAALLGHAFAAALCACAGLGLALAAAAPPGSGPRAVGALVGMGACVPAVGLALKGAVAAQFVGLSLVLPAALALLATAALAGAALAAPGPGEPPGATAFAAVGLAALAVASGLGAVQAQTVHELGGALANVDPSMRAVLLAQGLSTAVPFAAVRPLALAALGIPVVGVLVAAGARRLLPVGQLPGLLGTFLLLALCGVQAWRAEGAARGQVERFAQTPWSDRPDFQPLRHCELPGHRDIQGFLTPAGLSLPGADLVKPGDEGRAGGLIALAVEWRGEASTSDPSWPLLTLAVDRRVSGPDFLRVLQAAERAGPRSFSLVGGGPELPPAVAGAQDALPLVKLVLNAPRQSGEVLFASLLPGSEHVRSWQAKLGNEGRLALTPRGEGLNPREFPLAGDDTGAEADGSVVAGDVYLDLSEAPSPERVALAVSRLHRHGFRALASLTALPIWNPGPPLQAATGSLEKEEISGVVHRHLQEVKYCYESELAAEPSLAGHATVKFVIDASGAVASAEVASSTLGNRRVEACLASRVKTWTFPKPRGGGVVVVSHPFVFRSQE